MHLFFGGADTKAVVYFHICGNVAFMCRARIKLRYIFGFELLFQATSYSLAIRAWPCSSDLGLIRHLLDISKVLG